MSLIRYTSYLPHVGRQRGWAWETDGKALALDEQAVAQVFLSPSEKGLDALADVAGEPLFDAADLDIAPGEYGKPALAPPVVSGMEIWAAGVTYESSKFARMAESNDGGDVYARVYVAERPELFFKATPSRAVGHRDEIRVREDSHWNVPEPELTVCIAATGQILGFTVGNDVSSRDIEGANPLYLPQAKVYRGSCSIGPRIVPASRVDPQNLSIRLDIRRGGALLFTETTSTASMKRNVVELAEWLFKENDFPHGALMMTGTGIIPPDQFSLISGDEVEIAIEGIGSLINHVA